MRMCPNVSVSIRDREKSMNAIEWLENRVNAHREHVLDADYSDSILKYLIFHEKISIFALEN